MKCYRFNCERNGKCDSLDKTICIHFRSKKQYEYIKKIKGNCQLCGERTVPARVDRKRYRLCTECEVLIQRNQIKDVFLRGVAK